METLAGPLISALVEVAVARGVPRAALLDVLQVEQAAVDGPEYRAPATRFRDAWELTAATIGDDSLPVAAGRLATIQQYGVLGFQLYTSPTVRDAIGALVRFHETVTGVAAWSFEEDDRGGVMTLARGGTPTRGGMLASEQVLASFLHVGQQMLDEPLGISETWLERRAPADTTAHRAHFSEVIHWGTSRTACRLPLATLEARPRGADPLLGPFFRKHADDAARTKRESWMARSKRAIDERLPSGIPTAAEIAAVLEVSERTLRRRLQDEGTQFGDVVTQVQRARAEDMLAAGTAVRDVAVATGFADPTAFSRAYRRWTGSVPSSSKKQR